MPRREEACVDELFQYITAGYIYTCIYIYMYINTYYIYIYIFFHSYQMVPLHEATSVPTSDGQCSRNYTALGSIFRVHFEGSFREVMLSLDVMGFRV